MVKNIFKISQKKMTFLLKKIISVQWIQSNQFDFIHYAEIFLSKTQWRLTCVEYVLLFSGLHDVKTERGMRCKELFDKQFTLVRIEKTGNRIKV